jgi:hypothetical protein
MENYFFFAAGLVVQILLLLYFLFSRRVFAKALLGSIIYMSLMAVLAFLGYEYFYVMALFLVFAVFFSVFYYHEKLLPETDEGVVMFWILIYFYLNFDQWAVLDGLIFLLNIVMVIALIFALIVNFKKKNHGTVSRFFLYLIYTLSVGVTLFLHVFPVIVDSLFDADKTMFLESFSEFDVFSLGMVFVYLIIHGISLVSIFPHDYNSEQNIVKTFRKMVAKTTNYQTTKKEFWAIVLGVGGVLVLNIVFQLVDRMLFANLLIVVVSQGLYLYRKFCLKDVGSKLE